DVSSSPLIALPNGDVIFSATAHRGRPLEGFALRRYRADNGTERLMPAIEGSSSFVNGATVAVEQCRVERFGAAFDPATSALTKVLLLMFTDSATGTCTFTAPSGSILEYAYPVSLDPGTFAPNSSNP